MSYENSVTPHQMVLRILKREDNLYKKEYIEAILNLYMDECKKALLKGERVLLSGVGTIIPEVKTHRSCYLPNCDNATHENSPYVKLRMRQTNQFKTTIDKQIRDNLKNGIYGLENQTFSKSQLENLKNGGFIPEDEEIDYEE